MQLDLSQLFNTIIQSVLTSGLIGGFVYYLQRRHKILDGYKIEKNKALLHKTIESEDALYEIFKQVKSQFLISEHDLISFANSINQIRMDRYLYISNKIYDLSKNFADYLLEVAENSNNRSRFKEDDFAEKFKNEFRK